jgi:hypothetical protein
LSVAISFLARIVGLGNVGQKVREIIGRVQSRVDVAVNKLVDLVAKQGNSWLAGRSSGSRPQPRSGSNSRPTTPRQPGQPTTPNPGNTGNLAAKLRDREIGQTQNFKADGESHRLWIQVNERNKATVMLASDPKPLREFLNGQDVNKLNNPQTDPNGNVEKARKILRTVDYNASLVIAALTQNKSQEAETKDVAIEKAMTELPKYLKWIFEQSKVARLEIAKAVFGEQPFTHKQIVALFSYVSKRTVQRDLATWLKKGWLFTNQTTTGDDGALYGFKRENIPERNANQRNRVATNAEKIQYYRQILTKAGIDKRNWPKAPKDEKNPTETEVDTYRKQMREKILDKYGKEITQLDNKVFKEIGEHYGAIKGDIFKQWIVRHEPKIIPTNSIKFIYTNESGKETRVEADCVLGNNTLIEAKAYNSEGAALKVPQMQKYKQILQRIDEDRKNNRPPSRIPIINNTPRPDLHFTTIKYVFSNDATRKSWQGKLIQEIGSRYLKVWSPQDGIGALGN